MEKYEFDIKMSVKDMFAFMLKQSYGGLRGAAFLFVDLALIISMIYNWENMSTATKLIMLIITFVLVVVEPAQLYLKARAQVKLSERFQSSTHYVVDGNGITVSQGENSMELLWGHLHSYKNSKKHIYVYTSRASAFVFPKDELGEDAAKFLVTKLEEHKSDFMTLGMDSIKVCANGVEVKDEEKTEEVQVVAEDAGQAADKMSLMIEEVVEENKPESEQAETNPTEESGTVQAVTEEIAQAESKSSLVIEEVFEEKTEE